MMYDEVLSWCIELVSSSVLYCTAMIYGMLGWWIDLSWCSVQYCKAVMYHTGLYWWKELGRSLVLYCTVKVWDTVLCTGAQYWGGVQHCTVQQGVWYSTAQYSTVRYLNRKTNPSLSIGWFYLCHFLKKKLFLFTKSSCKHLIAHNLKTKWEIFQE